MKVLLVFAHPEPRSLNGALRDVAIAELKARATRCGKRTSTPWPGNPRSIAPTSRSLRRMRGSSRPRPPAKPSPPTRCADPAVSALVVRHAGDPQGLGRSGVRLRVRLWHRRAQRQAMGQPLRRRRAGRETRDVAGDRRRLGGALFRARGQRSDRRPPVSNPSWDTLLSRLRCASAFRGLPGSIDSTRPTSRALPSVCGCECARFRPRGRFPTGARTAAIIGSRACSSAPNWAIPVRPASRFTHMAQEKLVKHHKDVLAEGRGYAASSSRLTITAALAMMMASPPCSAGISSPPLTAVTVTVP
jgi:hypothetical protein